MIQNRTALYALLASVPLLVATLITEVPTFTYASCAYYTSCSQFTVTPERTCIANAESVQIVAYNAANVTWSILSQPGGWGITDNGNCTATVYPLSGVGNSGTVAVFADAGTCNQTTWFDVGEECGTHCCPLLDGPDCSSSTPTVEDESTNQHLEPLIWGQERPGGEHYFFYNMSGWRLKASVVEPDDPLCITGTAGWVQSVTDSYESQTTRHCHQINSKETHTKTFNGPRNHNFDGVPLPFLDAVTLECGYGCEALDTSCAPTGSHSTVVDWFWCHVKRTMTWENGVAWACAGSLYELGHFDNPGYAFFEMEYEGSCPFDWDRLPTYDWTDLEAAGMYSINSYVQVPSQWVTNVGCDEICQDASSDSPIDCNSSNGSFFDFHDDPNNWTTPTHSNHPSCQYCYCN